MQFPTENFLEGRFLYTWDMFHSLCYAHSVMLPLCKYIKILLPVLCGYTDGLCPPLVSCPFNSSGTSWRPVAFLFLDFSFADTAGRTKPKVIFAKQNKLSRK